ncbi:hypothetical protein EC973_001699 [Apophysomyces ossiformis]|uniref:Uncharacterized protein n=1 Tax=Apophysomyces ossiformis TaxID=679940 RepID=A0A8H7BK17_9FUNG|nr:hypothetical protein EC973_001699 [Apophysomyces ossiformis]
MVHIPAITAVLLAFSLPVFAQVQAVSEEFNITSPLQSGIYVAGRKLPVTYYLLRESSSLKLNIYLVPINLNYPTAVIAQPADVSEDPSNTVTIHNKTYGQHSYNYDIPPIAPSGPYKVVFQSVNTHTNTSVDITIRPYVSPTPEAPTQTIGSSASPSAGSKLNISPSSNPTNNAAPASTEYKLSVALICIGALFITTLM